MASPGLFIEPLAEAGATRVTVQYEILRDAAYSDGGSDVAVYGIVKAFVVHVHSHGMQAGLCVAPETDIKEVCEILGDLLEGSQPMVQFIDILAVAPGFGGQVSTLSSPIHSSPIQSLYHNCTNTTTLSLHTQSFDASVTQKIRYLYERYPNLPQIGCDGGISAQVIPECGKSSAQLALEAGANFLIAGTSLFGKGRDKGVGREREGEAELGGNMNVMVQEVLRVRQ